MFHVLQNEDFIVLIVKSKDIELIWYKWLISIIIDLTELFFSAVVRLMHVVIVACNHSRVETKLTVVLSRIQYEYHNWITLGSNYKNIKWLLSDVYYFFFQFIEITDFHLIFSPFPFTITWVSCVIKASDFSLFTEPMGS